jgi:TRAP-type C4-dicarboxylate transport system permease small subunit
MVLVVFGGLTYAQIRAKHIRVELLYMHMPPRVQSAMDLIAGLASVAFITLLLWQGFGEAQYSWEIGEATSGLIRFPLFPARLVLVFGAGLFLVQLILQFIEDVQRLAEGRGGRVDQLDLAEIDAISGGDTRA